MSASCLTSRTSYCDIEPRALANDTKSSPSKTSEKTKGKKRNHTELVSLTSHDNNEEDDCDAEDWLLASSLSSYNDLHHEKKHKCESKKAIESKQVETLLLIPDVMTVIPEVIINAKYTVLRTSLNEFAVYDLKTDINNTIEKRIIYVNNEGLKQLLFVSDSVLAKTTHLKDIDVWIVELVDIEKENEQVIYTLMNCEIMQQCIDQYAFDDCLCELNNKEFACTDVYQSLDVTTTYSNKKNEFLSESRKNEFLSESRKNEFNIVLRRRGSNNQLLATKKFIQDSTTEAWTLCE